MVPGPAADCSAGIAMAHFKSPLQDVVRAAQRAEKRAKGGIKDGGLDRSAVAVTLMKRSGETIEWGCKWAGGGLEAFDGMLSAIAKNRVSAKFPHRIVELVNGYRVSGKGTMGGTTPAAEFETVVDEVLLRDIALAVERQRGEADGSKDAAQALRVGLERYIKSIDGVREKVEGLIGLCQTAAFVVRNLPGNGRAERQGAES
jgi:CRISPR-associated protein Cmr2